MKFTITPTMLTQDRIEWEMKQEIDGAITSLTLAVCDLKDRAIREALIKLGWTPPGEGWRPIETLDKSKMDFVLVTEDGAVRAHLWNPHGDCWEVPFPFGEVVGSNPGHECRNPTHWMPIPEPPAPPEEKKP